MCERVCEGSLLVLHLSSKGREHPWMWTPEGGPENSSTWIQQMIVCLYHFFHVLISHILKICVLNQKMELIAHDWKTSGAAGVGYCEPI